MKTIVQKLNDELLRIEKQLSEQPKIRLVGGKLDEVYKIATAIYAIQNIEEVHTSEDVIVENSTFPKKGVAKKKEKE